MDSSLLFHTDLDYGNQETWDVDGSQSQDSLAMCRESFVEASEISGVLDGLLGKKKVQPWGRGLPLP